MEESDEDVQHDEDADGLGAPPSFAHKLKHLKVFEGMPVTFTCKVHGDPKPKVRCSPGRPTHSSTVDHIRGPGVLKCGVISHILDFINDI